MRLLEKQEGDSKSGDKLPSVISMNTVVRHEESYFPLSVPLLKECDKVLSMLLRLSDDKQTQLFAASSNIELENSPAVYGEVIRTDRAPTNSITIYP